MKRILFAGAVALVACGSPDAPSHSEPSVCRESWQAVREANANLRMDSPGADEAVVAMCEASGPAGARCFETLRTAEAEWCAARPSDDCRLPVGPLVLLSCISEARMARAVDGGCEDLDRMLRSGELSPDAEGRVPLTGEHATLTLEAQATVETRPDGRRWFAFDTDDLVGTRHVCSAGGPFVPEDFERDEGGAPSLLFDDGYGARLRQINPRWVVSTQGSWR